MDTQHGEQFTGAVPNPIVAVPNITQTGTTPEAFQKSVADALTVFQGTTILDRAAFKQRIHFWWNKSVEAILETGWTLIEAQMTLSSEEWVKFVNLDVPFNYSIIRKLMKLPLDSKINDPKYRASLPGLWTALYEISLMETPTFHLAVKAGLIARTATVEDLKTFRLEHDKSKSESKLGKGSKSAKTDKSQSGKANKSQSAKVPEPKVESKSEDEAPAPELPSTLFERSEQRVSPEPPNTTVGRIKITVSRQIAGEHDEDLKVLKGRIEAFLQAFDFIDPTVVVEAV